MVETIAANTVTLRDLKQALGLQQSIDPEFFPEWQQAKADVCFNQPRQRAIRCPANAQALGVTGSS
jgi:hypothetical protein